MIFLFENILKYYYFVSTYIFLSASEYFFLVFNSEESNSYSSNSYSLDSVLVKLLFVGFRLGSSLEISI